MSYLPSRDNYPAYFVIVRGRASHREYRRPHSFANTTAGLYAEFQKLSGAQSHGRDGDVRPENVVENQNHELRVLQLQVGRVFPERLELKDRPRRLTPTLMQQDRRRTGIAHPLNPESCAGRVDIRVRDGVRLSSDRCRLAWKRIGRSLVSDAEEWNVIDRLEQAAHAKCR